MVNESGIPGITIEKSKPRKLFYKLLLLDIALDGILVDEERARRGPCECIQLPTGKKYCWDAGIIGALDQDQIAKYCTPENTIMRPQGAIPQHVEKFIEASEKCKIGGTYDGKVVKDIKDRIECMSIELRKSGINLS